MLPKAHLTSHSRMSGSRWVTTSLWLCGSLRPFWGGHGNPWIYYWSVKSVGGTSGLVTGIWSQTRTVLGTALLNLWSLPLTQGSWCQRTDDVKKKVSHTPIFRSHLSIHIYKPTLILCIMQKQVKLGEKSSLCFCGIHLQFRWFLKFFFYFFSYQNFFSLYFLLGKLHMVHMVHLYLGNFTG